MNNNMEAAAPRAIALSTAILLSLLLPRALPGQQPESLTVDVGECVKLESPGERLDCYEAQVARARAKPPAPPAPAAPPAVAESQRSAAPPSDRPAAPSQAPAAAASERPAPPPSQRSAAPALAPSERAVRTEDARVARGSTGDGKITAAISSLRETVPNAWLITLDNGQVWRQDYPEPYALRVGQRVEIATSGRLSGVRLTGAGMRGSIQVERVR